MEKEFNDAETSMGKLKKDLHNDKLGRKLRLFCDDNNNGEDFSLLFLFFISLMNFYWKVLIFRSSSSL